MLKFSASEKFKCRPGGRVEVPVKRMRDDAECDSDGEAGGVDANGEKTPIRAGGKAPRF